MVDAISAAPITTRTKRVTRAKPAAPAPSQVQPSGLIEPTTVSQTINELTVEFKKIQTEFENLQKEIGDTKEKWLKEQKDHETEIVQRNLQEEQNRKIQQEIYEYELSRNHKKAEDDFNDQKDKWQKELFSKREEIERDKMELTELRKAVENFDNQVSEAVKASQTVLQKELTEKFETEKKLKLQESNSEKAILSLRVENLVDQNSKQTTEIQLLRKALDDASRQLKEIAVRVIDAGGSSSKIPHQTESPDL